MRIGTTLIATLLASQSGNWFDNALFGRMAIFYSMAFGLAILAKGGGDVVFTKELAEANTADGKPGIRMPILQTYLVAAMSRLSLAALVVLPIIYLVAGLGVPEVLGLLLITVVIVVGNALRICVSPNFQIGFDNTTFTIFVICLSMYVGLDIPASAALLAGILVAIYTFTLIRLRLSRVRVRDVSVSHTTSMPYMVSELTYYSLGFAIPILLSFATDMQQVGQIRSIERLVFAGTFILFLVNNRLFNDLSRDGPRLMSPASYFKSYSAPCAVFFLAVMAVLILGAALGYLQNLAAAPAVFAVYAVTQFVSVACGPVSGYLNFLGKERFVLASTLVGAITVLATTTAAIATDNPFLIVLGGGLGITVANIAQITRLLGIMRRGGERAI